MESTWFRRADFLGNLFDAVPSLLFVVDQDVRVIHLNSAAEKMLGTARKTVLMKRGGEVLHCLYASETPEGCGRSSHCPDCIIRNSVKRAFRGESICRETTGFTILEDDRVREVFLMITVNIIHYKGREFVLLVMEDITHIKKIEEELRRRGEQLEAVNRELEAFSYSVSHDLKAPLRTIEGFSRTLMEDYAGNIGEQGTDYLRRVRTSVERMSLLIDDMLRLSHVTQSPLRREEIDMSELATAAANDLRRTSPGRNIDFIIALDIRANADKRLLRIVLENLIGNAWKFTSKTRKAVISFGADVKEYGNVYYVRDNGSGFDSAYADKLFSPFQRLHSREEFPGNGIGLATVQRIIFRHGGRIWAEGSVNKGACFYFTL